MDDRLLVPATPALLRDWAGPVVWLPPGIPATWDGRVRVLCYRHGGTVDAWDWPEGGPDTLALDLARAECHDRVARVLADTIRSPHGGTSGSRNGVQWLGRGRDWVLFGNGDLRFGAPGDESDDGIAVAGLAGLDPHDDTRLPDGSRLVDALALAAVAREVLRG